MRWETFVGMLPVIAGCLAVTICLRYFAKRAVTKREKTVVVFLAVLIGAPACEELVFRAPLILLFETTSDLAWMAIVISALVFGAIHDAPRDTMPGRMLRVTATSTLGLLCGYYGIEHQSLMTSIFIHFAWNVTAMVGIPVLIFGLPTLLILCLGSIVRVFAWVRDRCEDIASWWRIRTRLKYEARWTQWQEENQPANAIWRTMVEEETQKQSK